MLKVAHKICFIEERDFAWGLRRVVAIACPYFLRMLSLFCDTLHNFFPHSEVEPNNFAEVEWSSIYVFGVFSIHVAKMTPIVMKVFL